MPQKYQSRWSALVTRTEIIGIIDSVILRRDFWTLSGRQKNIQALQKLGLDAQAAFDEIYDNLSWKDYIAGPLKDNHPQPIPGDIWILGLRIENIECYLKFQDHQSKRIILISLHPAEFPLYYPFKP